MIQELEFLKSWGLIFKQMFMDYPLKPYLNAHYKTCVDAYQALSDKKSCFQTDIEKGLKNLESYFLLVERQEDDKAYYDRAQYCVFILQQIEKKKAINSQLTMF